MHMKGNNMNNFISWIDLQREKKRQERIDRFFKESKWDFLISLWLVLVLLGMTLIGKYA